MLNGKIVGKSSNKYYRDLSLQGELMYIRISVWEDMVGTSINGDMPQRFHIGFLFHLTVTCRYKLLNRVG